MRQLPLKLEKSLESRKQENAFRRLGIVRNLVDFSSNDYLGFASSEEIFAGTSAILSSHQLAQNGAKGSRLLSGNHKLYKIAEDFLANFHKTEAALIFNSGYDANVGFFGSVPKRGDIILYDELVHASIREGISMSHAKSLKFAHNDLKDLQKKLERVKSSGSDAEVYIATESIFSMDGDVPDLRNLASFSSENRCFLVVDEAHAVGVFGEKGQGLVQQLGLEDHVFARLNTFGKGLGCHGAAILGSKQLRDYLVNFARSFIYTTALPPHSVATILAAYEHLSGKASEIEKLHANIQFFKAEMVKNQLEEYFIESASAIHCCIISGNERVKEAANYFEKEGFEVKPILSPTVAKGKERLRFCLHSFNSKQEISAVLKVLSKFVFSTSNHS